MPEPKTCLCGTCHYNERYHSWCYIVPGLLRSEYILHVDYCFDCGARLLPNGEVEPRGAVEAERDAFLAVLTEYFMLCPPDYQETCDMTDCAQRTVGCWKRWVKEQAAGPPDEPKGRDDE